MKICEEILFAYRSFVTSIAFLEGLLNKFESKKPKECDSELECSNMLARIQMRYLFKKSFKRTAVLCAF
jgi:hypothetical protein